LASNLHIKKQGQGNSKVLTKDGSKPCLLPFSVLRVEIAERVAFQGREAIQAGKPQPVISTHEGRHAFPPKMARDRFEKDHRVCAVVFFFVRGFRRSN